MRAPGTTSNLGANVLRVRVVLVGALLAVSVGGCTAGTDSASPVASSAVSPELPAAAAPCATVAAAQVDATKAAGLAVYSTTDLTAIAQDPDAPLCPAVQADMEAQLWADPETAYHPIPASEWAKQFYDNVTAYATRFSAASGKKIVVVFPYIGACGGALNAPGWAHTTVSGDVSTIDKLPCQVTRDASQMTSDLAALIATEPEPARFAVLVRVDPHYVVPALGTKIEAADVPSATAAGAHLFVPTDGDGSGWVIEPNVEVPAVGTTVPAGQAMSALAAGGHVYISPSGDGSGLVVDPAAPLPSIVVSDLHKDIPSAPPTSKDDVMTRVTTATHGATVTAMTRAGLSAFVVCWGFELGRPVALGGSRAGWDYHYAVCPINVPGASEWENAHPPASVPHSQSAALAQFSGLIALHPDVPVVKLG
jgi:hypothetical protein